MWASTTSTNANMGGLSGANTICQTDGNGGSFTFATPVTTHRAAIYTSTHNPSTLFTTTPLKKPNGADIANEYQNFWDTTVMDTLSAVTKPGSTAYVIYWVGNSSGNTCTDWSVSSTSFDGATGDDNTAPSRYNAGNGRCSDTTIAVLCISY